MVKFTLYDQSTAPEESRPLLERSRKAFGMIPDIHAVMVESPGFFRTYKALHDEFLNSSFDATEQTVVWQTINVEHTCTYCVPAHTVIAKRMKVDEDVIRALAMVLRCQTNDSKRCGIAPWLYSAREARWAMQPSKGFSMPGTPNAGIRSRDVSCAKGHEQLYQPSDRASP